MSISHRQQVIVAFKDLLATHAPLPLSFSQWPPAAKHLMLQTCRFYPRLECIANALLPKKPKDNLVWATIIVALCELFVDQKPNHAVIYEMVELIKKGPCRSASGLVNAILRRSLREQERWQTMLETNACYQFAHPQWFIDRLKKDWPNDWEVILQANNLHAPMTLRVNLAKISREDYLKTLPYPAQPTLHSKAGITLLEPQAVSDLPGFFDGLVSVQDEAAQLAVSLLDLRSHLRVLDACAAPGGKTCHILESTPDLECVALEPQAQRFIKLQDTLKRLKLNAHCLQVDATQTETWWDGKYFDRILIDAPCSGTGVIRRHPDIKLRRSPKHLLINTPIEETLLKKLWPLLAPGGILVYATCSILPEENDKQIEKFLAHHQDASYIHPSIPVGIKTQYGHQILPGQSQMDGFFYVILKKSILKSY